MLHHHRHETGLRVDDRRAASNQIVADDFDAAHSDEQSKAFLDRDQFEDEPEQRFRQLQNAGSTARRVVLQVVQQ